MRPTIYLHRTAQNNDQNSNWTAELRHTNYLSEDILHPGYSLMHSQVKNFLESKRGEITRGKGMEDVQKLGRCVTRLRELSAEAFNRFGVEYRANMSDSETAESEFARLFFLRNEDHR